MLQLYMYIIQCTRTCSGGKIDMLASSAEKRLRVSARIHRSVDASSAVDRRRV